MEIGLPNDFPTQGPWCEICKIYGHDPYHCPMMHKYHTVPKISYCNFCKSVGHDDKYCRTMDLMRETTSYTYRVQVDMMTGKNGPHFNQVIPPYNNAQPHYNIVQPQYNPTQYNQVPQYNTPRGYRGGYRGGG
jgi:hypothetical protein